ncbi:MAG: DUF5709 domain-containing protein [Actinomycetota bacterium]|nr:DUF5709 domain-containing protein [Actinomycetota bacterium]
MSQSDDTTPYNTYSVDEETQLQPEDTLVDRGVDDVLDEGYAAPEKWVAANRYGTTGEEEIAGEPLELRLAQEESDPALEELEELAAADDGDSTGDAEIDSDLVDGDGELIDDQVGEIRAGRLVEPDEGAHLDVEGALIADDEGFAGGAASAEEAAVHVVPDEDDL